MKTFLRSLSAKDIRKYIFLLLLLATGCWLGRFGGGLLAGAAVALLFFSILGKVIFSKTVSRLDKQVKDIIVNNS